MSEPKINLPDLSGESLWAVPDVAAYLKVSKSWVYQRAADGRLPSLNVGGLRRFDPEVIKRWARGDRLVVPISEYRSRRG